MQKLIFVIGSIATGKTYFIDSHYRDKDVDIFDVYDYQQRAYDEAGFCGLIPLGELITFWEEEFRCLMKANNMLLEDIINRLQAGRDVVVEQTFFKAKRRIAYIDKIRKTVNVTIETYVMCPSDEHWKTNLEKRKLSRSFQSYKEEAVNVIEFPNPAEGIDRIYEVVNGDIKLRMDPSRTEIIDKVWEELDREAERISNEDKAKSESLLKPEE